LLSDIQQLQESQAQTAETVGQIGEVVTCLANVTYAGFTEITKKINALVDAQIRTEENLVRTDSNVARTDENLKNLIAIVKRNLSGRKGE